MKRGRCFVPWKLQECSVCFREKYFFQAVETEREIGREERRSIRPRPCTENVGWEERGGGTVSSPDPRAKQSKGTTALRMPRQWHGVSFVQVHAILIMHSRGNLIHCIFVVIAIYTLQSPREPFQLGFSCCSLKGDRMCLRRSSTGCTFVTSLVLQVFAEWAVWPGGEPQSSRRLRKGDKRNRT